MKKLLPLVILTLVLTACGGSGGGSGEVINVSGNNTDNGNSNQTGNSSDWLIPTEWVTDGGPGIDGIPSLDYPMFIDAADATYLNDHDMVTGVKHGDVVKAYPHNILDWHEVVNDKYGEEYAVLSYCPLTGTSLGWMVPDNGRNNTYGVSGLLYNSNLILYDRASGSLWAQMLSQSVFGSKSAEMAENFQVIETTWETWRNMYPQTEVLSRVTGFSRNYGVYPYQDYRTSNGLLFNVETQDGRMHPKIRVLGVKTDNGNKVYPIQTMAGTLDIINDDVGDTPVVVIGSAEAALGVAYGRTLADGTVLDFTARPGELPVVMDDNHGNVWNIHGEAISGPRQGEKLPPPKARVGI